MRAPVVGMIFEGFFSKDTLITLHVDVSKKQVYYLYKSGRIFRDTPLSEDDLDDAYFREL